MALALAGCADFSLDALNPAAEADVAAATATDVAEPAADAASPDAPDAGLSPFGDAASGEATLPADAPGPAAATVPPPQPGHAGATGTASAASATAVPNAPQIHMAVQPDSSGPTSVVFAIDRSRDNTPSDEPAIRLTPQDGNCNPQELRRFTFPAESAASPVFGPEQLARGITARELPEFLAVAVTAEMMRLGLVSEPEQSQPQNVCTRKLWELLILNQSGGIG